MKGLISQIENLYLELEMSLTREQVNEFEEIIKKIEDLADVLEDLKTGDCWCQAGIGNPMITEHSKACLKLQKIFN